MRSEGIVRFHALSLAPSTLEDGGSFDYARAEEIFLGRVGCGPLRIGWDTNLLIDWAQYGRLILMALDEGSEGLQFPPEYLPANYQEELIALVEIIRLWQTRDIRIRAFERQLVDFRRPAGGDFKTWRERQITEIAAALSHLGVDYINPSIPPEGCQVNWLPPVSIDDQLIRDARAAGCHVFLSRDGAILRRNTELQRLGVAVMKPTDLTDALAFAGDLNSYGVDGLVCDNHKWLHLREAAGPLG